MELRRQVSVRWGASSEKGAKAGPEGAVNTEQENEPKYKMRKNNENWTKNWWDGTTK